MPQDSTRIIIYHKIIKGLATFKKLLAKCSPSFGEVNERDNFFRCASKLQKMFTDMQLGRERAECRSEETTKHLVITAKKFSASSGLFGCLCCWPSCLWLRLQKYNLWPHSRGFSPSIDKVAKVEWQDICAFPGSPKPRIPGSPDPRTRNTYGQTFPPHVCLAKHCCIVSGTCREELHFFEGQRGTTEVSLIEIGNVYKVFS